MPNLDPHLLIVNKQYHFDESMLQAFKFVNINDTDCKTYIEEETCKAFVQLNNYIQQEHGVALYLVSQLAEQCKDNNIFWNK